MEIEELTEFSKNTAMMMLIRPGSEVVSELCFAGIISPHTVVSRCLNQQKNFA